MSDGFSTKGYRHSYQPGLRRQILLVYYTIIYIGDGAQISK